MELRKSLAFCGDAVNERTSFVACMLQTSPSLTILAEHRLKIENLEWAWEFIHEQCAGHRSRVFRRL